MGRELRPEEPNKEFFFQEDFLIKLTNVGTANHNLSNRSFRARVEQDGDGFLIRGREGDVLAKITKK